jgi:hypothetical protein
LGGEWPEGLFPPRFRLANNYNAQTSELSLAAWIGSSKSLGCVESFASSRQSTGFTRWHHLAKATGLDLIPALLVSNAVTA